MEREKLLPDQPSAGPPSSEEKSSFSITGILDSVFKGGDAPQKVVTPTEHAHPPPPVLSGPTANEMSAANTNAETPPTERSSSFSLSGILGSVFKGGDATQRQATPTDPAHPPAPIVAGPSAQEVKSSSLPGAAAAANGLSTSPPPGRQTSLDEDTDLRRSSSEEPSQFHRSNVQESIPEDVFVSDSPISIPMLMSQAIKSDVVGGTEQEEDVVVVEEKSSRSKKSKGKKKKKKKKQGSSSAAGMTTTEAIENLAASLSAAAQEEGKTEERGKEREEEREQQEPSVALDDFVDTFGKGGVETAHPMPSVGDLEEKEERKTEQPRSMEERGSGMMEEVVSRDAMKDHESFPSSIDRGVGDRKGDAFIADKNPFPLEDDDEIESERLPEQQQQRRGGGEGGENIASENDKDSLLSPDFVKRDLLSEALEELEGMGGARSETRDDMRPWEGNSPSKDIDVDASTNQRDSPSLTTKDVFGESNKMDHFTSPSCEEERTIGGTYLSESVQDGGLQEGKPSSEQRLSGDVDGQSSKSPLQSSSDSAIDATKGASFTSSWSAGQYVSRVSTKIGLRNLRFSRSNDREGRRRKVREVLDDFDIIEMPKPHPTPEAPPCAGDLVCPQDSLISQKPLIFLVHSSIHVDCTLHSLYSVLCY